MNCFCKFNRNFNRIIRFLQPDNYEKEFSVGIVEIETESDCYVRNNCTNFFAKIESKINSIKNNEYLKDDLEILTRHYQNLMELK